MKYAFFAVLTIIIFIGVNVLVALAGFHRNQGHIVSAVLVATIIVGYFMAMRNK